MSAFPRGAVRSFRLVSPDDVLSPTADFDMTSPIGGDRARFHHRTTLSSYQNSTPRNRGHSRNSRSLVVVIPPPNLPLRQGQLGNVLSKGPQHRLSHGILMPLCPSLFGQLSAIAREFNFPSTVGLCLYLHINEGGITMTPRISEDSWQCLFAHLFQGNAPSTAQLPIGGSIEFDIDLDKARWFDAWVSGSLWDSAPASPPMLTSKPFVEAHWRSEFQSVNVEEQTVEGSHTLVAGSRPETRRHLPKKLSLVERLDLDGVNVPPRLHSPQNHFDSPPTHGTYASSPILQSPKLAESDLARRVHSWRVNTELYPASMVETYQPAPDVGVPLELTTMDEYALQRDSHKVVDIDEYLWSVASVGPHSSATESHVVSSHPSSVHLDRPTNDTLPITPSTVTSWGPPDDEWHPDDVDESPLPSPDLGERVIEDIMAPRRPAVWGNSFGWRSATTWKTVYPYAFIPTQPTFQFHLEHHANQHPSSAIYPPTSANVTDTHVLSNVYPALDIYPAVYPYFNIYPAIDLQIETPNKIASNVWYGRELEAQAILISHTSAISQESVLNSPPVEPVNVKLPVSYPLFDIYPAGYPRSLESIYPAVSIEDLSLVIYLKPLYPCIRIYPAVYPFVEPYPSLSDSHRIPGTLDECQYESAKAFLALLELKPVETITVVHPPRPVPPTLVAQQGITIRDEGTGIATTPPLRVRSKRQRSHMDLRASVLRAAGKRPIQGPKTHLQLHIEEFQDGAVWTPSGSIEELSSPMIVDDFKPIIKRRRREMPMQKPRRPPSLDRSPAVFSDSVFSDSGTTVVQSPQVVVPHLQPQAERSISPLRIRRAGIPSQPPLGIFEVPLIRATQAPVDAVSFPEPQLTSPQASPLLVRSPGMQTQSLDLAVSESPMVRPPQPPPPPPPKVVPFPIQPPPLPPVPPLRRTRAPSSPLFSPEIAHQTSLDLAVSETPKPRVVAPPSSFSKRTASARLSDAVKSITRRTSRQRSSSLTGTPENPSADQGRASARARLPSLTTDRPPSAVLASLPPTTSPPFLVRNLSHKESMVLQRIKAYEDSTDSNQSSGIAGTKGMHSSEILPRLAPLNSATF